MKLSEKWLREWITLDVSTEGLLADLTALGLEVEACESVGEDHLIDISLTPNRGDCLSVEGVARDLAAFYKLTCGRQSIPSIPIESFKKPKITLESSKACPHYVGRIIEKVDLNCQTPQEIIIRLEGAGIRAISPVVDITNYVMLEIGQPMHAFDLDQTGENIIVRFAASKEKIQLLDGSEKTLDPSALVIADLEKPIALAGVMGGLASSVTENTRHILLESAFFDPISIRLSARQYGLNTDSSYRFERGVDFSLQLHAMNRATELLLAIVGGKAGPITTVTLNKRLPVRAPVILHKQKMNTMLGFELDPKLVTDLLKRLNMKVSADQNGWQVVPPNYRFDIHIEEDLIEEIARLYGYQKIPDHTPQVQAVVRTDQVKPLIDFKKALVARGYCEAINYSFVSQKMMEAFLPEQPLYALENPISAELSVMRASLFPGLVQAMLYNLHRQQTRIRLFESGLQFCLDPADPKSSLGQTEILAGVCCGHASPRLWNHAKRELDFYDVKGDVEQLLHSAGLLEKAIFRAMEHPSLHPGQTAQICIADEGIGWVGALHPRLMQMLEITVPVYLFELEKKHICISYFPKFKKLSKFPVISRDLALIVDRDVLAHALNSAILNCVGEVLVDLKLFDVYTGKGIAPMKKSIAVELILQHQTRTLVDEEVNTLIERLLTTLKVQFGAVLRGED